MRLMPSSSSNSYKPIRQSRQTDTPPRNMNNTGIIFGGVIIGQNNHNRGETGDKKFGDIFSVKPVVRVSGNDVKDIASPGNRNGKHDGIGNRMERHRKRKWWNPWKNSVSHDPMKISCATQVTPGRGRLNACVQTSIRSLPSSTESVMQKSLRSLTSSVRKILKTFQQALNTDSPKYEKSIRGSSFHTHGSTSFSRGNGKMRSPFRRGATGWTSRPHIRDISFMETEDSSRSGTTSNLGSSQRPARPFRRDYGRHQINN